MISDPLAVLAVLAAIVYVAVLLEERIRPFRSLGAALVGILLGMLLSNIGVLPGESETYDFLVGPGVEAGIALILLRVDIRSVFQAGPKMLMAFGIGAVGTAIGAMIGGFMLVSIVGPETWKLAGQFAGTYTGGGVNFAAVGQAVGTSSDLFTAALAADVIVTALWMATCLAVPVLLGRPSNNRPEASGPQPATDEDAGKMTLASSLSNTGVPMSLSHAATIIAIAIGALWVSGLIATWIPGIPKILWLTTIVLIAAQFKAIQSLPGTALWGNYLVLLFLASNGARSVIANIVEMGPAVFYFALVTVAVHGLVIFGLGRLAKIDMPTLAVASQANVGGAASAMAIAGARGYADRLLPGVAVGLLGYAAGNYLGLAVASLMYGLI